MAARKKAPFDMIAARQYLAEQGVPVDSSKTETYVKRLYNNIKSQREQHFTPNRELARRGTKDWKYIRANKAKHTRARWDMRLAVGAFDHFMKLTELEFITLIISGLCSEDSPNRRQKRDTEEPITLSMQVPKEFMEDAINDNRGGEIKNEDGSITVVPPGTIEQLINSLTGGEPEWFNITAVSIANI